MSRGGCSGYNRRVGVEAGGGAGTGAEAKGLDRSRCTGRSRSTAKGKTLYTTRG
jgi:hypothetical protein